MTNRILTSILGLALLVGTALVAWMATSALKGEDLTSSAFGECWRLEGDAKQVQCLSTRLVDGARTATDGLSGTARDDALLTFVRQSESLAQRDQRLAGSCHPAMHKLGRSEGTRAADAGRPPAFPGGSSQLCTAGYVHGLAEGYLTGTPDADVAKVFPALCHVTNAREGCAHGVGHALIRARADERADVAAAGAETRCNELPGEFPTNCMNGVFMELAMRREPTPVPVEDFIRSCSTMRDVVASMSCWGYVTLNLRTNEEPVSRAPALCMRADLPGQFPCIEQYGRELGAREVASCAKSAKLRALTERCVDGAVGLEVGSGHISKAEALQACSTIERSRLQAYCERAVSRYAEGRKLVEQT